MRYYKQTADGIIISFGIGEGGQEITEKEYSEILEAMSEKPEPEEGIDYELTDSLEWRSYAVEPVDPEEDDADAEDYQKALEDLGVKLNEEE